MSDSEIQAKHHETFKLIGGLYAMGGYPMIFGGLVAGLALLIAGLIAVLTKWNFYDNPIAEKIVFSILILVVGVLYLNVIIAVTEKNWSIPVASIIQFINFALSTTLFVVMIVRFTGYDYEWGASENVRRYEIEKENNCCFIADYGDIDGKSFYYIWDDCPYAIKEGYNITQPCKETKGFNSCSVDVDLSDSAAKKKFDRCTPTVNKTDKIFLIVLMVFYGLSALISGLFSLFMIALLILQCKGWHVPPPPKEEDVTMAKGDEENNQNNQNNNTNNQVDETDPIINNEN